MYVGNWINLGTSGTLFWVYLPFFFHLVFSDGDIFKDLSSILCIFFFYCFFNPHWDFVLLIWNTEFSISSVLNSLPNFHLCKIPPSISCSVFFISLICFSVLLCNHVTVFLQLCTGILSISSALASKIEELCFFRGVAGRVQSDCHIGHCVSSFVT